MIKPQNRADGIVVWENVGPDDECEWQHGRHGTVWVQIVCEMPSTIVEMQGTLDPSQGAVRLERVRGLQPLASMRAPALVRPRVVIGSATVLMQR